MYLVIDVVIVFSKIVSSFSFFKFCSIAAIIKYSVLFDAISIVMGNLNLAIFFYFIWLCFWRVYFLINALFVCVEFVVLYSSLKWRIAIKNSSLKWRVTIKKWM